MYRDEEEDTTIYKVVLNFASVLRTWGMSLLSLRGHEGEPIWEPEWIRARRI
jgi:hypothetical protein